MLYRLYPGCTSICQFRHECIHPAISPVSARKAFFDMTGAHWMKQSMSGKPAATFVSTGTQNGGQEVTHMQTISCLLDWKGKEKHSVAVGCK